MPDTYLMGAASPIGSKIPVPPTIRLPTSDEPPTLPPNLRGHMIDISEIDPSKKYIMTVALGDVSHEELVNVRESVSEFLKNYDNVEALVVCGRATVGFDCKDLEGVT